MPLVPEDALFERIIERMKEAGGLDCGDLRSGDRLTLYVEDGQRIDIQVHNPSTGMITVSSLGPWAIWIHLTDDWGMPLTDSGGSRKPHRLCKGFRLYLSSWETPAVRRILLNDFDLTDPAARQKN